MLAAAFQIDAATVSSIIDNNTLTDQDQTFMYNQVGWRDSRLDGVTASDHAESATSDIAKTVEDLEAHLHPYNDILLNSKYDQLLDVLYDQCQPADLLAADRLYRDIIFYIRRVFKPDEMSLGVRLLASAEYFRRVNTNTHLLL